MNTDQHTHAMDLFGNERRPPLVIERDHHITGTHQGSVCVHPGGNLVVGGTQQGSVTFRPDSTGLVVGTIQGSLHVSAGATVLIRGRQQGSVHVARDGVVRVEPGGTLSGSLHIDGLVENRGTRGGSTSGLGTIHDLDGGAVKQPRVVDGVNIYQL